MASPEPDPADRDTAATAAQDGEVRGEREPLSKQDFEALARFRFGIRRYLRFSEETVRQGGLTPQQYQLLLALKGFPGREWASLRELADRLQLRRHSVVELINRAERQGLVQRGAHPHDGRSVRVVLTGKGEQVLSRLSALHRKQLQRMHAVLTLPIWSESPPQGQEPDSDLAGFAGLNIDAQQ